LLALAGIRSFSLMRLRGRGPARGDARPHAGFSPD